MTTFFMPNIQDQIITENQTEQEEQETVTPESGEENTTDTEAENQAFFQAIATLYGKIRQDEQLGYSIKIGSNRYRLFVFPAKYRGWIKQIENNPDQPLYLRVYPKYQIIPRKPPQIYFQVVAWAQENQWSEPDIYIFRGIWQFVPQVKIPVVSIYRNRGSKDYTDRFKAAHLPILMRRDDGVNPFRFNPKIAKEDMPPRWFIQAKFKFIPSKNCWGWLEDLDPPTQMIPSYKRPKKTDPQAKDSDSASKPANKEKPVSSKSPKPNPAAEKPEA